MVLFNLGKAEFAAFPIFLLPLCANLNHEICYGKETLLR